MPQKDLVGRAPRSEPEPTSPPAVVLVADQLLDTHGSSIVYNGTAIQAKLKQGEYGDLAGQLTMYSKMIEADTHLSAVVGTRRNSITKADQSILPAEGFEEDAQALAAVAYCQELVKGIIGWEDMVSAAVDGPVKGFYAGEIIWDGPVPIAVLDVPETVWKWSGGLQIKTKSGRWIDVPPDKFVVHSPRGNSAQLTRRGIMRPIAKWWLIKNIATRDWGAFVEVFGMPARMLQYPTSMSPNDPTLATIVEALRLMGQSGVAAVRKDFDLSFATAAHIGAGAAGSPHESLVRFADNQISKAVLGQTLTTDTSGSTGTYAAAKVHNIVRLDIAQGDAEGVAEAVSRDLFTPAVGYGLGWDYPVPRLALTIEDPADEETRSKVLDTAVNKLGLPIAASTAYEELRIDAPDLEDEDVAILPGESKDQGESFEPGGDGEEFRSHRHGTEQHATDPVPQVLDSLATLSAEAFADLEKEALPETIAAMLRANPELTLEDLERRLAYLYAESDPSDFTEHVTATMRSAIVNAGLEMEGENPETGDEDEGDAG